MITPLPMNLWQDTVCVFIAIEKYDIAKYVHEIQPELQYSFQRKRF